jgi:predicted transposase/invertase (TIGR01784 family)
VVLDALCVLEDGKRCNVEVQKANDDNHQKRVRYNTSCITANITNPGTKFELVPNVIGIFISKFDMFKGGKTIYHIDRTVREIGTVVDNGLQEIYVNTKIDDGSDLAELMKIYKKRAVFDYKKFPKTSKRKEQFIRNEGGKREMCELVESYARQIAEEKTRKEAEESARSLFENGVDFDVVYRSIKNLSKDELLSIYEEAKKPN